ncbi:MAG: hypothetical protein KAS13_04840 [Candidatus Omnitrophica bacterium]|nr:hypothetical protein [Candidatus Omnitrophota bacterium]
MDKGVKFLGVSAVIFKILAWISAVFFVIVSLIVVFGAGGDTPRVASIIFLLGGGLYFLMLFTAAEFIKLAVSIYYKLDSSGASSESTGALQSLNRKVDKLVALLEGKPSQ